MKVHPIGLSTLPVVPPDPVVRWIAALQLLLVYRTDRPDMKKAA